MKDLTAVLISTKTGSTKMVELSGSMTFDQVWNALMKARIEMGCFPIDLKVDLFDIDSEPNDFVIKDLPWKEAMEYLKELYK